MNEPRDTAAPTFAPLTPDRWDDLVALFGPGGACGGCWCMWWKTGQAGPQSERKLRNRRALKKIVTRGDEPGLLAYRGGQPIGWCAVEQRDRYPKLATSRVLKPVDNTPLPSIWSITCFFVKAGHRHQGVSRALIDAAKSFVATRGGRLIEAYPKEVDFTKTGANSMWTGHAGAFREAGFAEVARRTPTRPIMRLALEPRERG